MGITDDGGIILSNEDVKKLYVAMKDIYMVPRVVSKKDNVKALKDLWDALAMIAGPQIEPEEKLEWKHINE